MGKLFEDIRRKSEPDRVITEQDPIDKEKSIMIPKRLQQRLVEWYHQTMLHPGVDHVQYIKTTLYMAEDERDLSDASEGDDHGLR